MAKVKTRGRPRAINPDAKTIALIRELGGIQCTQREAAAVLRIHQDTFADFMRSFPQAREAWDDGHEEGKQSLRRHQFKMAETNATMAIWLGKQHLGQRDDLPPAVVVQQNTQVVTQMPERRQFERSIDRMNEILALPAPAAKVGNGKAN